eukprot:jgi/Tetstr1/435561/TSEL_024464.t1
MGVGEDPVGEDGMDIDAPAWPPADVEAADEGVIRKGDPGDFYMKVIAKKFRGVWHYGVITGVVTEWVLEDYGGATQWRAVFEDGSGKVTVQSGWVMEDCLHHMETFSILTAGPLFEEARVKAIMNEELASPAVVRSVSRLAVLGHMYKRLQGAAWFVTRWGLQNVVTEEDGPERKAQRGAKARRPGQRGAKARRPGQRGAKARRPGQRGAKARRPGQRGAKARRPGQRGAKARRPGQRGAKARRQGEWDGRGSGCYRAHHRRLAGRPPPATAPSAVADAVVAGCCEEVALDIASAGLGVCRRQSCEAMDTTSPPGQKWAASLVVSRVRAAGIEGDEKDMRKRVTRGRPDAKVRKLMAASSTAQPPGVVKPLTGDKKRKRPVKKRRGKFAESEAESEAQAEAEAEAEAARSSKRRVPRARKNKNKQ